ncbi:protein SPO16 homolog [Rhinophrynus dorsalis]
MAWPSAKIRDEMRLLGCPVSIWEGVPYARTHTRELQLGSNSESPNSSRLVVLTGTPVKIQSYSVMAVAYVNCKGGTLSESAWTEVREFLQWTEAQGHEVTASLQNQHHKVRLSEFVESGTIIFPLSGIAFLLASAQDLTVASRATLFDRVEKFISVHRNCFLVLTAALHGPEEWNLMFSIQQRFLGSNLRLFPAHNNNDVIKMILTIAKVTCKPHLERVRDRLLGAKSKIIENSPVWKTLDQL